MIKITKVESASSHRTKELTKESILSEFQVLTKLHNECISALDRLIGACDSEISPEDLQNIMEDYQSVKRLKNNHLSTMEQAVSSYYNEAMDVAKQRAMKVTPEQTASKPDCGCAVSSCVTGY